MTELAPGHFGHLPAKTPCIECPLRKDAVRGALGGYTPQMYIDALKSPADIACHISKGFDTENLDLQRSCFGVAAFRTKVEGAQHPLSQAQEAVDHVAQHPDKVALCFTSEEDFIAHHTCPEGEAQRYRVKPKSTT